MRLIPLAGGALSTSVDDEDFERLSRHHWSLCNGYVARYEDGRTVYMHSEILPLERPYEVDHDDRDKLNNQRANLRRATRRQNAQNLSPKGGASRFHGVARNHQKGKWAASVRLPNGTRWQRQFDDELTAALAAEAMRFLHQTHAHPDPALGFWTMIAHRDALAGVYS